MLWPEAVWVPVAWASSAEGFQKVLIRGRPRGWRSSWSLQSRSSEGNQDLGLGRRSWLGRACSSLLRSLLAQNLQCAREVSCPAPGMPTSEDGAFLDSLPCPRAGTQHGMVWERKWVPGISGTTECCSQHAEPRCGRFSFAVVSTKPMCSTTLDSTWRKSLGAAAVRERRAQDRYKRASWNSKGEQVGTTRTH